MKFIYSIFLTCILPFSCFSQKTIEKYEIKIDSLFAELIDTYEDSAKIKLCNNIEEYMIKALELDNAKLYPFNKLKYVGKISSPDKKLRIINWNCNMKNGDYRYFSLIQHSYKGDNSIVKLKQNITEPYSVHGNISPENWPGALYYKIIPFKTKKKIAYVLLAWDANTIRTNKKIIEIVSFNESGNVVFGLPVIYWRGRILNRVVFEYAQQARMSLSYNASKKKIIFDHLSPSESRYNGQMEYYGPDFTYDALEYNKGRWNLYENIDVRNMKK